MHNHIIVCNLDHSPAKWLSLYLVPRNASVVDEV